jgi:hypothetical protein
MASVAATIGPIPLGLGTFEGTCVAMLGLTGVPLEAALTATLLLRGLTFWLPMLPGLWIAHREVAQANKTSGSPAGSAPGDGPPAETGANARRCR